MAALTELLFVERPEDVALVVRYFVFLQECKVLLAKSLACMVLHLITDVINHSAQLGVRVRKRAEALLPGKPALHRAVLVDVVGRASFDISDQIREGDIRLKPNEDMSVV